MSYPTDIFATIDAQLDALRERLAFWESAELRLMREGDDVTPTLIAELRSQIDRTEKAIAQLRIGGQAAGTLDN